jgi:hypothetical protein
MKAMIGLLFVGGLVLGGIYFFGGYNNLDPEQQAAKARAALKPGMSLMQAVKAAGGSPRIQKMVRFSHTDRGKTYYTSQPGNPVDFDYDKVQKQVKAGELPAGFQLLYNFSLKTAFVAVFDEKGILTDVEDVPTMGNLLQTR